MSGTFCRRPVGDGADGGEYCGEPVLAPSLNKTCYDHAHVCVTCGEPTEYDEVYCPQHGDEVPNTNES